MLELSCCQGHPVSYIVSPDVQFCPKGMSNCHKLSFYTSNVSQYFTSDATFTFLSGIHTLDSSVPVIIANIANITFTSNITNAVPTIQCNNGTFGFNFQNISNITIRGMTINGCGRTIHDSGLLIKNVTTVVMERVSIERTLGVGVRMENVNELYVYNCSFSNNGIGVDSCTLSTYHLWYGMHITTTNNPNSPAAYSIINTSFTGNPHSSLGGGLHIYILDTASVNITVDRCQFIRITGCLSAGADITIEGNEGDACFTTVKVSNSFFSDNSQIGIENYETNLELDGGALMIKKIESYKLKTSMLNINVSYSVFIRNKASYCGAAAIAPSSNYSESFTTVYVQHCMFSNNSAQHTTGGLCINPFSPATTHHLSFIEVSNSIFHYNSKTALHVWVRWSGYAKYVIGFLNCSFYSNTYLVDTSGHNGFMSIRYWSDDETRGNMTIIIEKCSFINNIKGTPIILTPGEAETPTIITNYTLQARMFECVFDNNRLTRAYFGSGLQAVMPNGHSLLEIRNCTFSNSEGSAIALGGQKNLLSTGTYFKIYITNVTVTSVVVSNGVKNSSVIFIACPNQINTLDIANLTLCNNIGTALSILGCATKFYGHNLFHNNTTPYNGGGIAVYGIGYVLNMPNAVTVFSNNRASLGGAIYSSTYDSPSQFWTAIACTYNHFNPTFINNTAVVAGNDVYGGTIVNCFLNTTYIPNEQHKCNHISAVFKPGISSDPYSVYLCIRNSTTNQTSIALYPGQYFNLTLSTTGYCNHFSPGFLDITMSTGLHIEAGVHTLLINLLCQEVSFKPSLLLQNISSGQMIVSIANPKFDKNSPLTVDIDVLACPHGMQVGDTGICQCEKDIADTLKHIQCNISWMPNPFIKSAGNYWLHYDTENNCSVIANICPLDYCSIDSNVHFNLDDNSDEQCSNNRTGTLCGQCKPGLSVMLGSNACSQCTNTYLVTIVGFIIAGILLVVFILILNMTVSIGSINGLLFYANVVKLNESVLFPNGSIPVISQFISWINLDLGIEVCFYNGLDGYWKTWLQYVFPLYIWLLTGGIIVYSHYSIRFSRYLRSNIISVLATLVLMSFTKISRNITSVFMATTLRCGNNVQLVWSIDGNMEYLATKHLILVVFSAIGLVFLVLYTIILTFYQWLQHVSNYKFCKASRRIIFFFHPFIEAYTGPYIAKYRYWTGVLLVTRIVITTTFMYTSGSIAYTNNYVIILIEGTIIFNILHPTLYQSLFNYYCERFFHLNFFVLCLLNSVLVQSPYKQYSFVITICSVAASFIMFIVIVVQQLYKQYLANKLFRHQQINEGAPLLPVQQQDNNDNYSPANVVNRRESAIFLV